MKFSDEQQRQLADDAVLHPGMPSPVLGARMQDVKKPGEAKWKKNTTVTMSGFPTVACPDGTGTAVIVLPTDPDTGASN